MTNLQADYNKRREILLPIADNLEVFLRERLINVPRIDRICVRVKSVERFLSKAKKYSDPLNQIQDQIGARIVTFYKDDVENIAKVTEDYMRHIEAMNHVPDCNDKFGYFGKHYTVILPDEVLEGTDDGFPKLFELQIKTLFQHAWSEANHDLGYKPDRPLNDEYQRMLAFTSAQAWGADMIFNELFNKLVNSK